MAYQLIDVEDGVDTLELQNTHPEWFVVTGKKGAQHWTLRPDIKAVLRGPYENARRKWEEARDRFELTETNEDRRTAVAAALELTEIVAKLEDTNRAVRAKYDRELPN